MAKPKDPSVMLPHEAVPEKNGGPVPDDVLTATREETLPPNSSAVNPPGDPLDHRPKGTVLLSQDEWETVSGFPPNMPIEDWLNKPFVCIVTEVREVEGQEGRAATIVLSDGRIYTLWEAAGTKDLYEVDTVEWVWRVVYSGQIKHPKDPKKSVKRFMVQRRKRGPADNFNSGA